MPKITPFIWFDNNAEEAIDFYLSVFENSGKLQSFNFLTDTQGPADGFMTGTIVLEGQEIMVLNGGTHFKLTSAFSLCVTCEDQAEVDYFWDRLIEGGTPQQCGWLVDKFGLTWQIMPRQIYSLLWDGAPDQRRRALQAMWQMVKLDIDALQKAHDGE